MTCFIIAALTADGLIGKNITHKSTKWTSQADASWFTKKSIAAQVVVMGRATYETIGKALSKRITVVMTKITPPTVLNLAVQQQLSIGKVYYSNLQPSKLLEFLSKIGFDQVAVAGGASIYTLFMKAGVVNKLYLTIEPLIFGQGIKLFNQELALQLKLLKLSKLSKQTILLEYQVLQ